MCGAGAGAQCIKSTTTCYLRHTKHMQQCAKTGYRFARHTATHTTCIYRLHTEQYSIQQFGCHIFHTVQIFVWRNCSMDTFFGFCSLTHSFSLSFFRYRWLAHREAIAGDWWPNCIERNMYNVHALMHWHIKCTDSQLNVSHLFEGAFSYAFSIDFRQTQVFNGTTLESHPF